MFQPRTRTKHNAVAMCSSESGKEDLYAEEELSSPEPLTMGNVANEEASSSQSQAVSKQDAL